jgi:hypothetical protein
VQVAERPDRIVEEHDAEARIDAVHGGERGGRLAFVCWRALADNPWARVPAAAVASVLGPPATPPPPDAPGPFAFADDARVRAILLAAGFADIDVTPFDAELQWTDSDRDEDLRDAFVRIGPAARRLVEAPEHLREPAIAAIIEALAPYRHPTGLKMPAAVWIVSAR